MEGFRPDVKTMSESNLFYEARQILSVDHDQLSQVSCLRLHAIVTELKIRLAPEEQYDCEAQGLTLGFDPSA